MHYDFYSGHYGDWGFLSSGEAGQMDMNWNAAP